MKCSVCRSLLLEQHHPDGEITYWCRRCQAQDWPVEIRAAAKELQEKQG